MDLGKERNVLSKRDTGFSASYRNIFILELIILVFHPNNWFKGEIFFIIFDINEKDQV